VNQGWSSSKSTPNVAAIHQEDFEEYLHRGYTVFAVVTSSQPKFTITEQMEDVHRAVRFIRTNTSQFGVRTDRLGMMGAGSGGQLALMVATQGAQGKADAPDPIDRESSEIQAVACFFPPTDFLNYGQTGNVAVGRGPMANYPGAFGNRALLNSGRASLGKEISPIYYVTSQLPPTLIIHGSDDKIVPLQQSESFVEQAKSGGVQQIQLIVRQGKGHAWYGFWKTKEDALDFAGWFDRHLRDRMEEETIQKTGTKEGKTSKVSGRK